MGGYCSFKKAFKAIDAGYKNIFYAEKFIYFIDFTSRIISKKFAAKHRVT
tara:strand:- start:571 stop:720 length:150 start_codon:yes stop_codon:yes gene_type:complete